MALESKLKPSAAPDKSRQSGGWFVYDGKVISGPLAADKLVRLREKPTANRPLMVSRRGFDRWYPIAQFDRLLQRTAALSSDVSLEKDQLQITLEKNLEILTRLADSLPTPVRSALAAPTPAPASESWEQTLAQATMTAFPAELTAGSEPRVAEEFKSATPADVGAGLQNFAAPAHASLAYSYMLMKGRQRLGDLRSVPLTSFATLVSLGLYWLFWYRNLFRELHWHVFNDFELRRMPSLLLVLVPGGHFYLFYKLAQLLEAAEQQNSYKKVSPFTVVCLAILPPLAAAYLQALTNKHWLLHVRNDSGAPLSVTAPIYQRRTL